MAPAMLQRRPAKMPGETVEMPTFIASQVVPQTKQMKTNIARCDAVAVVFIGFADVLLPARKVAHPCGRVPRLSGMARMRQGDAVALAFP